MKLRYYLRGLAVGVILTTILLSIANADNKPLTDTQIRQRALELGMVESDSLKLSDVAENSKDTTESKDATEGSKDTAEGSKDTTEGKDATEGSKDTTEGSKDAAESSKGATEGSKDTGESSAAEGQSNPSAESGSASKTPSGSAESAKPGSDEPVIVTIEDGDSSYTVSKTLAAAGVVEDAAAFDKFLCDSGYSRKIHIGTYEFSPGMTYEEIAEMIAY